MRIVTQGNEKWWGLSEGTVNESVPKIIINDSKFSLKCISILLILNHKSFRVLFDKIASVYFIWKIYKYTDGSDAMSKWPAHRTSTVPVVSAHFRSLCMATFSRRTSSLCKPWGFYSCLHLDVRCQTETETVCTKYRSTLLTWRGLLTAIIIFRCHQSVILLNYLALTWR